MNVHGAMWLSQSFPHHQYVFLIQFHHFYFFFFFLIAYLPSPNLGLTPPPPGTYKPNSRGSDACRGSNSLWTRTLDRYTRAGLPECVVSTMSGPPPKTTQDRTQTNDTHPIPGQKLKFPIPLGIEPGPPGWKAGTLPTTPRRRDGSISLLIIRNNVPVDFSRLCARATFL